MPLTGLSHRFMFRSAANLRFEPTGLPSVGLRLKRWSLAGPKNERSGPEKGRRAARPVSGLWGRDSGQAGLLTCAFSRQRSASLRSLRAAADAPIVGRQTATGEREG